MGLSENQRLAIEELYVEMYHPLSAYAQSELKDRPLAEEAVQDTFRIACAKADVFLSSPNPKGWLVNTLKHVIENTVRSRARLARMVISIIEFNENIVTGDIDEPNIDFLYDDICNSEEYKLLKRIALDKYSMLEAAQELGISVEACKKRVQRARKKLEKRFEENN